jgi:hypothetical protein
MGRLDILLLDNNEPSNYMKAILEIDCEKWFGTMRPEIESMHDNQI